MIISSEQIAKPGDIVFSSNDDFEVISYYASHGLLLLKSRMNGRSENTHLLFQDVRAHELRMWIKDGLIITKRDSMFLNQFSSKPADLVEVGNEIYEIASSKWRGYVVGGMLAMATYPQMALYESPLMGTRPDIFLGREMRN